MPYTGFLKCAYSFVKETNYPKMHSRLLSMLLIWTFISTMYYTHEKHGVIALILNQCLTSDFYRAVARSKNPGGLVLLGGDNEPPLFKIGLTDLPKTGGG